jgi:hypothetical protein
MTAAVYYVAMYIVFLLALTIIFWPEFGDLD